MNPNQFEEETRMNPYLFEEETRQSVNYDISFKRSAWMFFVVITFPFWIIPYLVLRWFRRLMNH